MGKLYECYQCNVSSTELEWNNNSHYSDDLLPDAVDGVLFDCPSCGEVICGDDLIEI